MIDYNNPLTFIPLLITSLTLALAAFKSREKYKIWILIAFVVWLVTFVITIFGNKLFG